MISTLKWFNVGLRGLMEVGIVIAGTGLGLLVASSYSAFFWWWAIGALLYGVMLIVALKVAA